jgi:hypothetical protein
MKLPRPVAAAALFEEAVDALHRIIEDLDHYRLVRKNGRFINTYLTASSASGRMFRVGTVRAPLFQFRQRSGTSA